MFGAYRYFLATLVALQHVSRPHPWVGIYAVFAFYCLSGYLMALVLSETYGPTLRGAMRFLVNRILRIYPPYLIALVFAAAVAYLAPAGMERFVWRQARPAPSVPFELLPNLTLIGLSTERARWIPQAWSLYVEISWYVIIALPICRLPTVVWAWVVAAVAWVVHVVSSGDAISTWSLRYFTITAAALPFGLGALVHLYRDRLPVVGSAWLIACGAAFVANVVFAPRWWGGRISTAGFYTSLVLAMVLTGLLARFDRHSGPSWWLRLDQWLGDVAFAVFLTHLHVAAALWSVAPDLRSRPISFFVVMMVVTTALSAVIHRTVEQPLARLRSAIRSRAIERA